LETKFGSRDIGIRISHRSGGLEIPEDKHALTRQHCSAFSCRAGGLENVEVERTNPDPVNRRSD
jgi:hypothetical protein